MITPITLCIRVISLSVETETLTPYFVTPFCVLSAKGETAFLCVFHIIVETELCLSLAMAKTNRQDVIQPLGRITFGRDSSEST